jgi:dinuclear metal center YbgI/SA1388 family protein
MSVRCQVIIDAMDKLAPKHLAEDWDNVGLLVGNPAQIINKILIVLDVTKAVVEQAIEDGVDLIIAHHPVIFKSITAIRTDLAQGQILSGLLKSNIGVYVAHTNLDVATGGVNDALAAILDLHDVKNLAIGSTEKLCKLVVFVPQTHEKIVEETIMRAGAGHIGNYSHCSFKTNGIGTFLPLEGSHPFIGNTDKLEHVQESRLETIMPEKISRSVIRAMLKVHPYEEVAYDIYPLMNHGEELGLGRIGKLVTPMLLADFASQVKVALGIQFVNVVGDNDRLVKKVAVCGGAGSSLLYKAAFAGADVLVTGDVKYHEGQEAVSIGMAMIDAGHFATEQPVLSQVEKYLNACATKDKWSVNIKADAKSKDIFCRY